MATEPVAEAVEHIEQRHDLLTPAEKEQAVKNAHHNDLRLLLGILFVIYGVIVTLVGVINPTDGLDKTGGIQINLWSGVIMLLVGIAFLIWNFSRPIPDADIIESAEESARQSRIAHETLSKVQHSEFENQVVRSNINDELQNESDAKKKTNGYL